MFDNGLGFAHAVGTADLGDGVKAEHTTVAELAQAGQGGLETVDGAQRILSMANSKS
ncbi:MAG: hypothetical protein ABJA98_07150 [Acidobacteriota bacterium]